MYFYSNAALITMDRAESPPCPAAHHGPWGGGGRPRLQTASLSPGVSRLGSPARPVAQSRAAAAAQAPLAWARSRHGVALSAPRLAADPSRSEERRVGKECRSRGWTSQRR